MAEKQYSIWCMDAQETSIIFFGLTCVDNSCVLFQCALDLSFGEEVTFRLVEGSGPVFLSAQELVGMRKIK